MKKRIFILSVISIMLLSGCATVGDTGSVEKESDTDVVESSVPEEQPDLQEEEIPSGDNEEPEPEVVDHGAQIKAYADKLNEQISYMESEEVAYSFENTENLFAIQDIDCDGRDELIIELMPSVMAGMTLEIYDYDDDTSELHLQYAGFPSFRVYDNGVLQDDASHNQGNGVNLWPYELCVYDKETDAYVHVADISSCDKEVVGEDFPDDVDADGDGTVYYINGGDGTSEEPVDGEAYESWLAGYMDGAKEIEISWQNLTRENVDSIPDVR